MKKFITSILILAILFSGFSSVQAEEVTEEVRIGTVTYAIYDRTGVIMNQNPQNNLMAEGYWADLAIRSLSEGEYTFSLYLDLTKSAPYPFADDPYWFRDSTIYVEQNQSFATVEEAKAAAREAAQNFIANPFPSYDGYNASYVFFDPFPIVHPGNAYAYGHDKDGLAHAYGDIANGKEVGNQ